jgi:putative ABC transport system permease protein
MGEWFPRLMRGASWPGLANAFGLAVAFAAAILLAALVRHELNFNSAIDPLARAAEIVTQASQPGRPPVAIAGTTGDLASGLKAAHPDLAVARMFMRPEPQAVMLQGEPRFETVLEADADIVDILTFRAVQGDVREALARPDGVVLTTRAVARLFGQVDALGRSITIDKRAYRVMAVIETPPQNTRLAELDIVASSRGSWTALGQAMLPEAATAAFVIGSAKTFVALNDASGVSAEDVMRTADALAAAAFGRMMAANPDGQATAPEISHRMVGLRDIDAARQAGLMQDPNRADTLMLVSMSGLALLVVLVAVLNYVNLSTSRASHRAVEIAVRKAFGASRTTLAGGLLGEGVVVALASAILGLGIAVILQDWFSSLVQRPLEIGLDTSFLLLTAGAAILAGILAGAYPAVVLLAFRPSLVLGARGAESPGAGVLRKSLMALQVGASVATIALSATVQMQLAFLTGAALGFDDRNVVVYRLPSPLSSTDERLDVILGAARDIAGVEAVAAADAVPNEGQVGRATVRLPSMPDIDLTSAGVTQDYFRALGIEIVAGRAFDARGTGASAVSATGALRPVVLTRKSVAALGFATPSDAVGAVLPAAGPSPWRAEVIGVVADHPLPRLRDAAPDAIYLPGVKAARHVVVRLAEGRGDGVAGRLDDVIRGFFPDRPPDRYALTARVAAAHLDTARLSGLVAFFAVLSAGSALLGVLGMSSAMARHMRREAAVRKAFGAPASSIAGMLIGRLSAPVMIGMAAGSILAWGLADRWLAGFPRRVEVGIAPEMAACLLVAVLALAVAGWQTARLARTRPSDILGFE